ncbi:NAD(P)/FAD-dependent oxidoreductase [Halobaculum sp. MBLA0147]|uniref:NAD(P)/FAD-dependent oxidoreductase n=1 Tax=Halobaculum sp. MBLA0147 TaxID=3079934 RepID=UPI003526C1D3
MTRVAIIGCGAAGAATAYVLGATDTDCVVFERRESPGGRAATRRRETASGTVTYDYGANYLETEDDRVTDLVETVAAPRDTPGPIYTFDGDGTVTPGRDADEQKLSTPDGVTALVRRLVADSDATLRPDTPVTRLHHETASDGADEWVVETPNGDHGPFDAVVCTPPAPVTATLLADSEWDEPVRDRLVAAARDVPYATVWSVVAGYERALDRPYYALVDTSDDHSVGWIARESRKPGHVPSGEVLLVQGAHDWSARHADAEATDVTAALVEAAGSVINEPWLRDPDWTDATLWERALPEGRLVPGPRRAAEAAGCYVAGDWVVGEGRLHAALRSGLDVAERLVYGL